MSLRWLVLGCLLASANPVQAYCLLTTDMPQPGNVCASTGINLAWRRSCLSFSMMPRASESPDFERIRDVTEESFRTWTDVRCDHGPVGLRVGQTQALGECEDPEYNQIGPNANTIIFVENWRARELPPDAFGLTLVWHNPDTGEIYDADMQINETLGELALCGPQCTEGRVDLQNVITHEAGHFFGLGHSTANTATMSSRARVGEVSKRDLSTDDEQGLCAIYGEDESDPECSSSDFMPENGFSPECSGGDRVMAERPQDCSVARVGGSRLNAFGQALAAWSLLLGVCLRRRARRRSLVTRDSGSLY
jgi:hypothetical protein